MKGKPSPSLAPLCEKAKKRNEGSQRDCSKLKETDARSRWTHLSATMMFRTFSGTCFSANLPFVIELASTGSVGVTALATTIASSCRRLRERRREG